MKNKMYSKKYIVIISLVVFCFMGLYGCNKSAQKMNLVISKSIGNEDIIVRSVRKNEFFFEDISQEKNYNVRHSFFSEIPPELSLQITMESQYEGGNLYKIRCDFTEDFPERYESGTDRLSLGYFYVQNNTNTIYRICEENMTDEVMKSEEDIIFVGSVVCQEEELEDILSADERGLHEWIIVDADLREYHSYNNLTETGFYEQFIWKRGHGLVYYVSGYGAEKDMIELNAQ